MLKISTAIAYLLTSLLFVGAISYAANQPWPLKRTIDLSSGFGDFRPNRFHAGVDLRTGGAVGARVYSPVDGYIWRVRMSYRGYGKGLYVRGNDGHIYVFGHLSKFAEPLETAVRKEQFRKERYYVVVDFPRDSIRVKQGQLIAFSGKTGIGAPHLHFEKRTPGNVPIDPLNHGFVLDDTTPPSFERIGFHLLDNHSLFSNGRRKMFLPVRKISDTEYVLDTVLYMNAPFGVLAHCYDQMRPGGMRQAVKKLVLGIDGIAIFDESLDSLEFEDGPESKLCYDPFEVANDEKRVRRLYSGLPYTREIEHDQRPSNFTVVGGKNLLQDGKHLGRIVAEDAFGNRSTLSFEFEWEKKYVATFPQKSTGDTGFDYRAEENGLAVTVSGRASQEWILTFDKHLDTGWYRSSTARLTASENMTGSLFMTWPPGQKTDRISVRPADTADQEGVIERNVVVTSLLAGEGGVCVDSGLCIIPRTDSFWKTNDVQMLTVEPISAEASLESLLVSEVYLVGPEAFVLRSPLDFRIKLDAAGPLNKHAGLCWYDPIEEEWVWIDNESEDDNLAAGPSLGGGLFAAIVDTTAPKLTGLNLKRGHRYWNNKLRVKFKLEDNLSGFEDDRSLDVRIDGHWLLPEFDIEDGEVVATLKEPLALGNHTLTVAATDRAGNKTERKVEFEVIRRSN